jgi:hypothetical protein
MRAPGVPLVPVNVEQPPPRLAQLSEMRQRRCDDKQGTVIAKRAPQLRWIARSEDIKSHCDGALSEGKSAPDVGHYRCNSCVRSGRPSGSMLRLVDRQSVTAGQAVEALGEVVGRAGSDLEDQSVRRRVRGGEGSDGISKRSVVSGA